MSDTRTSPALSDYLARLDAATATLPPWRRAELRTEVTDHLGAALEDEAAPEGDEAAVRRVLDRLGPPEDIAAAELTERGSLPGPGASGARAEPARRITALEGLAVVFLVIGGVVIPILGWFIGVVLLWMSPRWTVGHKLLGTLIWPGGLFAPLAGMFLGLRVQSCPPTTSTAPEAGQPQVDSCASSGGISWAVVAALVAMPLAQLAVAAYLLMVAGRNDARSTTT